MSEDMSQGKTTTKKIAETLLNQAGNILMIKNYDCIFILASFV